MNKLNTRISHLILISGLFVSSTNAMAFNSGSTESDGAFSPTADIDIQLPEDGTLNYTDMTIPAGVHVTFSKNTSNTPVTLLVSGNVTIDGVLDVSGAPSGAVGSAGDGNSADDGNLGEGGPGGYAGGAGGVFDSIGGTGLGSGGGAPGPRRCFYGNSNFGAGGAGGGYSSSGFKASDNFNCLGGNFPSAQGGPAYGSASLVTLQGGSGGGGGHGGLAFPGSGGGGGGALLIAASGTVTINGSITADGGPSGSLNAASSGGSGGGGSGGAIRIVASTITGNGGIFARGGAAGTVVQHNHAAGSNGAPGFITANLR